MQSSVRLCVVAPTVNVSFGGQTVSHKARHISHYPDPGPDPSLRPQAAALTLAVSHKARHPQHHTLNPTLALALTLHLTLALTLAQAPVPRDKIRTALELQVLPGFTRAFTQEHENMAPDGGSMDDWLKETTVSMQRSIEKHLSQVFAG